MPDAILRRNASLGVGKGRDSLDGMAVLDLREDFPCPSNRGETLMPRRYDIRDLSSAERMTLYRLSGGQAVDAISAKLVSHKLVRPSCYSLPHAPDQMDVCWELTALGARAAHEDRCLRFGDEEAHLH